MVQSIRLKATRSPSIKMDTVSSPSVALGIEQTPSVSVALGSVYVGGTSVADHSVLINRNLANQHPESAISNLVNDLASRPSEVITDAEINNL